MRTGATRSAAQTTKTAQTAKTAQTTKTAKTTKTAHGGSQAPLRVRKRPRHTFAGAAWLAAVLIGAAGVGLTMVTLRGSSTPRHTLVVASMPYWNIGHGTSAVLDHQRAVTEASPWMYG